MFQINNAAILENYTGGKWDALFFEIADLFHWAEILDT